MRDVTSQLGWVRCTIAACALASACGARTDMRIPAREVPDAGAPRDAFVEGDGDIALVCDRELTISFTPTARAQLALWAEAEDRFATIGLTMATGLRGIGNRPGALQMNSGYRWPIGRRENVLPAWASSRLAAGGPAFRRVIYRNRAEGFASSAGTEPDEYRDTRDDYFCMSFVVEDTLRDNLDAVTCASTLDHDKGRYITGADVAAGYAEPMEAEPGVGGWRALGLDSGYPPRRDLIGTGDDHPDVSRYAADALAAMPELDAVTMPTPAGEAAFTRTWAVPGDWPAGPLRVSIEVNTEGDYAPGYDPASFPTPTRPDDAWDHWSRAYGYPYRGQPSVIFDLDLELPPRDERAMPRTATSDRPARVGTLDGSLLTGVIDATIVDDPLAAPGSGADRLRRAPDGTRVRVEVRQVRCRAP